jgi:putative exosortase-associated protein (TIGR04073 family)
MRIAFSLLALALVALFTGCAGPENKFGRGINNLTEIVRGGEMQRAMEQTAVWDGADQSHGTGFARGFTRTMARTGIGIYEVVTFPFPPYGPVATSKNRLYPDPSIKTRKYPWGGLELSEHPVYPDAYKPGFRSGSPFDTDKSLGFSGGEVAPWIPGSKFTTLDP